MTFRQFGARAGSGASTIPTATGWSLAELGEAMGKQELFTRQSPQRLRVLREHALIESAISSNRIEGVEVDQARVTTLMFGQPVLRDRDEEEVRGYRDALNEIHNRGAMLAVSEQTIRDLHRRTRGGIWEAGQHKQKAEPIIERYPDGRQRVRFMPVEAGAPTEAAMAELIERWSSSIRDRIVHPLVALGAFALDFLCIHPFRDGNGRTSRLMTLLLAYHAGLEVGRYISLERLIEQNKQQYYETLQFCSQGWHEGKHDPWRFINFMLLILKDAYREFEARVGQTAEPRGAKAELVRAAVAGFSGPFRVVDLERACPGVSRDLIRLILRKLRSEGSLRSMGRGLAARWERISE